MSKLKKVWNENKILFVLGAIILVCLIVVIVVSLTFFYGSSESPYGHRLDITEKVPLKDDLLKELKNTLESTEKVSKANLFILSLLMKLVPIWKKPKKLQIVL